MALWAALSIPGQLELLGSEEARLRLCLAADGKPDYDVPALPRYRPSLWVLREWRWGRRGREEGNGRGRDEREGGIKRDCPGSTFVTRDVPVDETDNFSWIQTRFTCLGCHYSPLFYSLGHSLIFRLSFASRISCDPTLIPRAYHTSFALLSLKTPNLKRRHTFLAFSPHILLTLWGIWGARSCHAGSLSFHAAASWMTHFTTFRIPLLSWLLGAENVLFFAKYGVIRTL